MLRLKQQWLVGLRFTELNIPKDAVISNAYLEFTQKDGTNDTGDNIIIEIAVEDDTGDADSFSGSDDNVSSRSYSGNTVEWTDIDGWDENSTHLSVNIKDLIATAVSNSNCYYY